ncbi:hypothetical protein C8R42DRAFT_729728 [Lentinula raphanica]|nr:hypothetical protein C8R42DRAFT_729728 [Lentinula raphanica]
MFSDAKMLAIAVMSLTSRDEVHIGSGWIRSTTFRSRVFAFTTLRRRTNKFTLREPETASQAIRRRQHQSRPVVETTFSLGLLPSDFSAPPRPGRTVPSATLQMTAQSLAAESTPPPPASIIFRRKEEPSLSRELTGDTGVEGNFDTPSVHVEKRKAGARNAELEEEFENVWGLLEYNAAEIGCLQYLVESRGNTSSTGDAH